MSASLSPLSIFKQVSDSRDACFSVCHDNKSYNDYSTSARVVAWLCHKVVTVICVSAGLVEFVGGTAGLVLSACTLGAFKVAVFAVTLGNVKLNYPTGCLWFAERVAHSLADEFTNITQIAYDATNLLYQGYRAVRWVAHQLHFGDFFSKIFHQLGKLFKFIAERVEQGIIKAASVEEESNFNTPWPLNFLDDLTKKHRIDFQSDERSLEHIFKHYVLSVANIPLNATTAIGAAAVSVVLSTLFVTKVAIYTATNIHVPVPTYANKALAATTKTGYNAIKDTGCDIGDSFVLLYKTSNALGISRVMVTALSVLKYIPEALFA